MSDSKTTSDDAKAAVKKVHAASRAVQHAAVAIKAHGDDDRVAQAVDRLLGEVDFLVRSVADTAGCRIVIGHGPREFLDLLEERAVASCTAALVGASKLPLEERGAARRAAEEQMRSVFQVSDLVRRQDEVRGGTVTP